MKKSLIIILVVCIVFINAAKPIKKNVKAKVRPNTKEFESQIQYKFGAYNPAASFHVKDPYYRFRFMRKSVPSQSQFRLKQSPAEPEYTNTLDTIPEMKIKLTNFMREKTQALENQSRAFSTYEAYRASVEGLDSIKNNNDLCTHTIDRGIEKTLTVIRQLSHVTIQLLNLDANLEQFNYNNFRFLSESTPEIESLKEVYNELNEEVQTKREELVEMRRIMDVDYKNLMDAKAAIVSRDKYRTFEVQQAFEQSLETFEESSSEGFGTISGYSIQDVATLQASGEEAENALIEQALHAVESLEKEVVTKGSKVDLIENKDEKVEKSANKLESKEKYVKEKKIQNQQKNLRANGEESRYKRKSYRYHKRHYH